MECVHESMKPLMLSVSGIASRIHAKLRIVTENERMNEILS